MLNKNTLGVKKCEANKKQPYLRTYVQPKSLISAEAKKSPNIKRWPSDKANHTCENIL